MSRPKAREIHEQEQKLLLIAEKFGWRSNSQWQNALNIQNSSTITSWKSGGGIDDKNKDELVAYLNKRGCVITLLELISDDIMEFAVKLKMSREEASRALKLFSANQKISKKSEDAREQNGDISENRLIGKYIGIYYCHAGADLLRSALAVEKFEIYSDELNSNLILRQANNYVTGKTETGSVAVKDGRILAQLEYDDPSFPNSIYYLMEIILLKENKILYGLYTDVTDKPVREIFSTKFLLFSLDKELPLSERSYEGDYLYDLLLPFVKNDVTQRARFVVEPPTYELRGAMINAVRKARETLEQMEP